jgi:hypothetical protein
VLAVKLSVAACMPADSDRLRATLCLGREVLSPLFGHAYALSSAAQLSGGTLAKLVAVRRKAGRSVLIISHFLADQERFDRIIDLRDGTAVPR